MTKRAQRSGAATLAPGDQRLYTLEVSVIGGPVTRKFSKKNPVVSRAIQIKGNQTLRQLHDTIFAAFDRYDEHMYEFQVGGKGPMDPDARRYVLPQMTSGPLVEVKPAGVVSRTEIASLGLKVGETFGYWFDFGDDWWHQIIVEAIDDKAPPGHYPKVIKRTGESPPQYAEL